ncbi:MAG: hypothetical protein JXP73_08040 [Deltaproteobacteria bacterium]|nr:hypothetical protein [Deltaproteobacteria bacterium]
MSALGEAVRSKVESSRNTRLAILLGGIVLSQGILYGPCLVGAKLLLPLDMLWQAGVYLAPTPKTAGKLAHDSVQSDLVDLFEPERQFVVSEMRAGRWPEWNPGQYAGSPVLMRPWLSPLSILPAAVRSPVVLAWQQLLLALVAGAGFYLFCRGALRVGFWAAVCPAWVYPMTGFFVFWLGAANPVPVVWLPWLWLAIDRVARGPSMRSMGMLALVVLFCLCARQLDASAQVLFVSGAYAVWRILGEFGRRRSTRPAGKAGAFVLGGYLLGMALASPHVLPLLDHARTGERPSRRARGAEDRPPGDIGALPLLVLPDMRGSTKRGSYPTSVPFPVESLSVAYAGLVGTLFLAPLAWRSRRHRSFAIFALALACFSVAWCLGLVGFVGLLRLPPLNMLSHNRLVFAAAFAILAMSSIGLDSLREPVAASRRRWLLVPFAFVFVLSAWWFYRAVFLPEPIATEIDKFFREGKANRWIQVASGVGRVQAWFRWVYFVGGWLTLFVAACWALLASLQRWRWWLSAGLATVMFADLLWFAHGRSPQIDPAYYYPKVPALEQIAARTQGRIIGVGCLPATLAQMSGLRDVRGYDGIDPARYTELLLLAARADHKHTEYSLVQWMSPRYETAASGSVKLSPVLDLLGVEYVIFRGKPSAGVNPPIVGADYWALRNPSALPRAFVPRRAENVVDDEERLAKLASEAFDPRDVVYVETPVSFSTPAHGRATITAETTKEIALSVAMDGPGLVVLADRWDSGWRATVNGEPAPILVADHALRAVMVPRGASILKFVYRPASFTLGLVLCALAAALLAAGLVIESRRPQRPGNPRRAPAVLRT